MDVKVIPCENTAVAARMVSESADNSVAALSSKQCAELYQLEILEENTQNNENNYTKFICISKKLEIYPGAKSPILQRPSSSLSVALLWQATKR